jgi:hypothetical protein
LSRFGILVLLDPAKVVFIVFGGFAEAQILLFFAKLFIGSCYLLLMGDKVPNRVRIRLIFGEVVLVLLHRLVLII